MRAKSIWASIGLIFLLFSCAPKQEMSLLDGYFHDEIGHWKEYAGDSSHQKQDYGRHDFSSWSSVEGGQTRECLVCGYEETHLHEYDQDYSYDESGHWRAATCSHDDRTDAGPHEFETFYLPEDGVLYLHRACTVCPYEEVESTFDPEQLAAMDAQVEIDGALAIRSLEGHMEDEVINFPSEIDGVPVERIRLIPKETGEDLSSRGAVFLPRTVKNIFSRLSWRGHIDLFYDGTLEDYLAIKANSFNFAQVGFSLHLRDERGAFYELKRLEIPSGTTVFPSTGTSGAHFTLCDLEAIVCNPELKALNDLLFLPKLRHLELNEGLERLSALQTPYIHELRLPSTLRSFPSVTLPFLYRLEIPVGFSNEIEVETLRCMRLIALFDRREGKKAASFFARPPLFEVSNEEEFELHEENGFLYVNIDGEPRLIDYAGEDFVLTLPDSLGGMPYTVEDAFFCSPILSGSIRKYTWEDMRKLMFGLYFRADVTVPLGCKGIVKTGEKRLGSYTFHLRFAMGEEEAKSRIPGGADSYFYNGCTSTYFQQDGEWVPFTCE